MTRTPLVLLFSLAAACRRDPPPRPPAAPTAAPARPTPSATAAPPTAAVDPPAEAAAFRETARFLPQGAAAPGWTQSGPVRVLAASELFQVMDGAADKYVQYGVRQLARTEYRKAGTALVMSAEVYDMGSALGAYGQYTMLLSDSRDPASMRERAVALGGGGFLGATQLVFWKGSHLVQVTLADESDEPDEAALTAAARDVLPAIGARLAAALPGEVTPPTEASALPSEGLVWSGATYLADNVLGVERSGPGWVGHYEAAGAQRYRLAVLTRPAVDQAHATLQRYRATGATALAGVGDEAFTTPTLAAARKGSTVVVVGGPLPEDLTALPAAARVERLRAAVAALH